MNCRSILSLTSLSMPFSEKFFSPQRRGGDWPDRLFSQLRSTQGRGSGSVVWGVSKRDIQKKKRAIRIAQTANLM